VFFSQLSTAFIGNNLFTGNPTPKQAGAGTESPSDLPSHLDYPIIFEHPTLEEGSLFLNPVL
jgi:hypothetical protein